MHVCCCVGIFRIFYFCNLRLFLQREDLVWLWILNWWLLPRNQFLFHHRFTLWRADCQQPPRLHYYYQYLCICDNCPFFMGVFIFVEHVFQQERASSANLDAILSIILHLALSTKVFHGAETSSFWLFNSLPSRPQVHVDFQQVGHRFGLILLSFTPLCIHRFVDLARNQRLLEGQKSVAFPIKFNLTTLGIVETELCKYLSLFLQICGAIDFQKKIICGNQRKECQMHLRCCLFE